MYFVLTSVQVLMDPQLPEIEALLDASRRSGYARAASLLRRIVPSLPAPVFESRMRMLGLGLSTRLSKWLLINGPVSPTSARRYKAMVRDNIDYMVGGFSAPVRRKA